jgi:hypothetical protein
MVLLPPIETYIAPCLAIAHQCVQPFLTIPLTRLTICLVRTSAQDIHWSIHDD